MKDIYYSFWYDPKKTHIFRKQLMPQAEPKPETIHLDISRGASPGTQAATNSLLNVFAKEIDLKCVHMGIS